MVVGLTGRYCAGKSTIAEFLEQRGWLRIDVDKLGHEVLNSKAETVAANFGGEVVRQDGGIDRSALGRLVFADPARLQQLEAILHPAMVEAVRRWIQQEKHRDILIDAAVLFRMGLHSLCDRVLFVEAPVLLRLIRGKLRDNISISGFLQRNRSQKHIVSQARSEGADIYRVSNWGCRAHLYRKVAGLLDQ
ncbi:MAG: dephospho-CoA kinase [Spirochaeta sp.]